MATYAGETVTFKTSATDIDDANTPLTSADVDTVEITIVDTSDDSTVLAATAMTWNATDQEWRYAWTTPATAGSFVARLEITGTGGSFSTWEYGKVKTKANPAGF